MTDLDEESGVQQEERQTTVGAAARRHRCCPRAGNGRHRYGERQRRSDGVRHLAELRTRPHDGRNRRDVKRRLLRIGGMRNATVVTVVRGRHGSDGYRKSTADVSKKREDDDHQEGGAQDALTWRRRAPHGP